ncbi:HAD family hydrolase [Terrimonas alba]|uniref:HAD family hydrolase n=1 Tax=Terrimonas alba TaxID=3349636 RepID=UPI0035F4A2A8
MAIKNIIFDLGGVILNIDLRKTQDAFTSLGVKNIEEVFRMGHVDSFFKSYEVGAIDDTQFIDSIQKLAGIQVAPEIVVDAWNALLLDFPPERINFLKELKSKYRLYLLSNTSALHHVRFHEMFKQEFGGSLDDLFDKAYYSHLIRLHKPETAAYKLIVDENDLTGDETLFIDDSAANVEGAERAGLKGLHLANGKTILDLGL